MKYMIMMLGDQATMMEVKSKEWIMDMIEFMGKMGTDLTESGELIDNRGLADPSQAKTVSIQNGIPVATDGPYAEVKESLGGYFVLDCPSFDHAVAWAARIPAASRGAVEVRPVHVDEEA